MSQDYFTAANLPSRNSQGEYEIGPGVLVEWLDEGRIVVFKLTQPSRDSVDLFVMANLMLINNWDNTEPLAFISDGTHRNMGMTPYMTARLPEIGDAMNRRDIKSYGVVLMRHDLVGNMIRRFGERFYRKAGDMELAYFTTYDDALEWLRFKLKGGASDGAEN